MSFVNLKNRAGLAIAACLVVVIAVASITAINLYSNDDGLGVENNGGISIQAATTQQAMITAVRTSTLRLPWLKPDKADVPGADATFVLTIAHGDGTGTALFKIKARQPFFGIRYALATGEIVGGPRLISKRQAIEWMALEKSAGR